MRLGSEVNAILLDILGGHERPTLAAILERLNAKCLESGVAAPARATVYNFMAKTPGRSYRVGELPPSVQQALYNIDAQSEVPGRQLVFYCFNYGTSAAMMFAAGMPWLALYQAARMRGFRDKSKGPVDAVILARGI